MRPLLPILIALSGPFGPDAFSAVAPREARIETVLVTPRRSTPASVTSELRIVVGPDDTIRAMVRRPVPASGATRRPLAILAVGIETGKEAVDLIEGHEGVVVFAMDYPVDGGFDVSGWGTITSAFDLREAMVRTLRNTRLALDWLIRLPDVDTDDVTMVAVSFGVFTGVRAAAEDRRITRLAVVQAGGMIDAVIEANSDRLGIPLPAWLSGKLGQGILSAFEPNDYAGEVSPRTFLLVSGESDRFFPRESIRSLWEAAREPKEWVRHDSPHVMPDERELIVELTNVLAEKLYGPK